MQSSQRRYWISDPSMRKHSDLESLIPMAISEQSRAARAPAPFPLPTAPYSHHSQAHKLVFLTNMRLPQRASFDFHLTMLRPVEGDLHFSGWKRIDKLQTEYAIVCCVVNDSVNSSRILQGTVPWNYARAMSASPHLTHMPVLRRSNIALQCFRPARVSEFGKQDGYKFVSLREARKPDTEEAYESVCSLSSEDVDDRHL